MFQLVTMGTDAFSPATSYASGVLVNQLSGKNKIKNPDL